MCGNQVTTFPIKKRINTELFIDRTATLYMVETQIREEITEGDEPVDTSLLMEQVYLAQKCSLDIKKCLNARSCVNLS